MKQVKKTVKPDVQEPVHVSDKTLREFMGYNLKRSFNVIQSELIQILEPFGLRMVTYSTLVMIADNPGMRQSHLSDALSIERPNLVVIIDELERRELIMREQSKIDRRAFELRVTLAGKQLCEKATEANRQSEARLLKDIDPEIQKLMLQTLNKIEKSYDG